MTLIVTNAGLAASLDAASKGIKLKIKNIGFGSAGYVPDKSQTSLKDEFLRTEFTDTSISPNTLNMNVVFDDLNQSFDAKEIGYYLEDDTLFAVDSLNGAILSSKHKGAILTESFEIVLSDNLIDSITVDVIGVSRATENNIGIAKIATNDEAFDVENDSDIVTPKKLHDVLDERVVNSNLFINGDFSINQRFGMGSSLRASEMKTSFFADHWRMRSHALTGGDIIYQSYSDVASIGSGFKATFLNLTSSWYVSSRIELAQFELNELFDHEMTISVKMSSTAPVRLMVGAGFIDFTRTPEAASVWSAADSVIVQDEDIYSVTLKLPQALTKDVSMNRLALQIDINIAGRSESAIPNNTTVDFKYAKCELGSVATKMIHEDRQTNLLRCRRYYKVTPRLYFKLYGAANHSGLVDIDISDMRCAPSIIGIVGNYDSVVINDHGMGVCTLVKGGITQAGLAVKVALDAEIL